MEPEGGLNRLEKAVLAAIAKQYPAAQSALQKQFAECRVVKRENTGAGFYTHLGIDRSQTDAVVLPRVIGKVWASIAGRDQMTFLLFIENGYAAMLEGAAIAVDTSSLDFGALTFAILEDPAQSN